MIFALLSLLLASPAYALSTVTLPLQFPITDRFGNAFSASTTLAGNPVLDANCIGGGGGGGGNTGFTINAKFRNVYSSSNVTTSAFLTIYASTSAALNAVEVFDSSGQTMVLSYASSCGALSASTNAVYIFPGGNGLMHIAIPSGQCVGIQAVSGTANTGEFDANFLQ